MLDLLDLRRWAVHVRTGADAYLQACAVEVDEDEQGKDGKDSQADDHNKDDMADASIYDIQEFAAQDINDNCSTCADQFAGDLSGQFEFEAMA